jgi:hypothetical protein
MARRPYLFLTGLAASLLATGCCCPALSGRYCDPCCCQPQAARCCCPLCVATRYPLTACCPPSICQPQACPPPQYQPQPCPPVCQPICPPDEDSRLNALESSPLASYPHSADCPDPCCKPPHCSWLRGWFARQRNGVPSQQHPDYYSPPAKFHPIPTRPAFEPLPSYPPLLPADSGMNNPLRASIDRSNGPTVR